MGYDAPARAALVERYRASVAGVERKAWRESWLHDFAIAERARERAAAEPAPSAQLTLAP